MSEFSSEPGDYSLCRQVLVHLWTLVDGEPTDECSAELTQKLLQHVKDCPPCEDNFKLEEQILGLIGAKCRGEKAPANFRQQLMLSIRETTVLIDGDDELVYPDDALVDSEADHRGPARGR